MPRLIVAALMSVLAISCHHPALAADARIGTLLVAGDIGKCPSRPGKDDEATAAVLKTAIAAANADHVPVRVLALGDLAYDSGSAADFKCFDASWGQVAKPLMLPVPGNHEYQQNPDAEPYFTYFRDNPLIESNGDEAGYYAVNFPDPQTGPWHLIALNAYVRTGLHLQLDWLKADLAANTAPCVAAFFHPYILSSGNHGHRDDAGDALVIGKLMLPAFEALYQAHATVLFTGHEHAFEQFHRHDPEGKADAQGVRSFVVGTGGGGLRGTDKTTRWATSEVYDETHVGVLKVDLFADHYAWSFLPVAGQPPLELSVTSDTCNAG